MKNLPLTVYPPLARKAKIFYDSAKLTNEIVNRTAGSYEVSYYLLSHAIELSIKACVEAFTNQKPSRGHRLLPLVEKYKKVLKLTNTDLAVAYDLDRLNTGRGGLRYPNKYKGDFYPHIFADGLETVEHLLERFE